jgi:tRNA threonylcarbamoyladenosine biosynthesis protein TsaB
MSFDNGGPRMDTALNLLAFDSSTETLRVGVQYGSARVLEENGPGGAHASASLIPLLQSMLARCGIGLADLDAIVFGRGPGSFTGLRTACAVAQGLGFGAQVPVLGVDTLLALAEDARSRTGAARVVALLDARMDEVYTARYAYDGTAWRAESEIVLANAKSVEVPAGWTMAGNVFQTYGDRLPATAERVEAAPAASALLRVAPSLIAAGMAQPAARAMPVYIRDKVAQTTEERAAARAAQATRT